MERLHVLAGLLAAFTCSGLEAQTGMTAKIPFDFQLASKTMPAGEYRIDYSNKVLKIRSMKGTHIALVLTRPRSRSKASETGVLEFRRYGDSYFFAGVWAPNSAEGGGVLKTSREKEVAKRAGPVEPAAIALNNP